MEEDSTTNRIALLWLELINQSFVGYTDLYVNLWTFYSNILFIRPKKRANIFPTNIFPPPALKYHLLRFIYSEGRKEILIFPYQEIAQSQG